MGSKVNPFEIPEVQERICSQLSVAQLFNSRLINHDFNTIVSKQLTQAYQGVNRFQDNQELTSFIEVMQNRIQEQVIYTRYKIQIKGILNELVTQFCSKIGPHVTFLTILDTFDWQPDDQLNNDEVKHIIIKLLASTFQLKYLDVWTDTEIILTPEEQSSLVHLQVQSLSVQFSHMSNRVGREGQSAHNVGMSLGLFLASNSRSLKEVTVPVCYTRGTTYGELPYMKLIAQIKVNVKNSTLFVLPDVSLHSDPLELFQQLDQLGLKFRSINFQIWNDTPERVEFLTQWIKKQESLEEFDILFGEGQVLPQWHFPTMKALKKLSLTFVYYKTRDPAPPFAPVQEGQFPNLKFLTLKAADGFGTFRFPLPKVTHLEVIAANYRHFFTSEWHRILPKLKSIRLLTPVLDENAATKVSYFLTNFENLEELELRIRRNKEDRDKDLTGVWDTLTVTARRVRAEEFLAFKSNPISFRPHDGQIPALENLKDFTFGVGNWTNLQSILFLAVTGALKPCDIHQFDGGSCDIKDPESYKSLPAQVQGVVNIKVEVIRRCKI